MISAADVSDLVLGLDAGPNQFGGSEGSLALEDGVAFTAFNRSMTPAGLEYASAADREADGTITFSADGTAFSCFSTRLPRVTWPITADHTAKIGLWVSTSFLSTPSGSTWQLASVGLYGTNCHVRVSCGCRSGQLVIEAMCIANDTETLLVSQVVGTLPEVMVLESTGGRFRLGYGDLLAGEWPAKRDLTWLNAGPDEPGAAANWDNPTAMIGIQSGGHPLTCTFLGVRQDVL